MSRQAEAAKPRFIIGDEVTSALDQPVAEAILKLLNRLRREVVTMRDGHIVGKGLKTGILEPPHNPYTELLLSSVPEMDPDWLSRLLAAGAAATAAAGS